MPTARRPKGRKIREGPHPGRCHDNVGWGRGTSELSWANDGLKRLRSYLQLTAYATANRIVVLAS